MIRHIGLRIALSAMTIGPALHLVATHAAASTRIMQMPHISAVSIGKGTPVILIPGLSSPRTVWDGVVPSLAKNHRVYVVQVNGFAGDAPGENLSPDILDGIVEDLHALIEREKIAGAAIVGHSMGGLVALKLAEKHQADPGRIMIVDALPFIGTLFSPAATVAMVEPQAKAMRDAQVASYGKPVSDAAAQAIADRLALKPASRALVSGWVKAADPRVSGAAMYEDMTSDLRPAMKSIATPITLVYPWSSGGPTKPHADAMYRAAYKDAPHVTFVDIGEAGHFVMLDQPALFQEAVGTFLSH
ncbi:alpha/beta fold hydrolase [Sphingomonas sp. Leaf20]|uniref:alpha/beta fold hydrolase n=1 Tax=Sphingomonas sp. Leaf20 TaxID=1735685 RepID=UPI0006F562A9|nr:alpha/beta hydrolase [Sphingomonas sp. Leaf20]KQM69174.1 alpha/beta hydrolase [Sphingomonas sp. Leaf20]